MDERGLIGSLKDLAGRAKEIIEGIVIQLQEKVSELLDAIFGSGEDVDPDEAMDEVEAELEEWATDYADMVATTEIAAAVEESIVDQMQTQSIAEVDWIAEPDACQRCLENAEASPIPLGSAFPSGDTAPPAHPRCRCNLMPA